MDGMEPLQSAARSFVRSLLARSPMSPGKFEFAWRQAVGPALERAAKATLLEDGTVEVSVDDPAWRREVKRSQTVILGRLRELLGKSTVVKLKFKGSR